MPKEKLIVIISIITMVVLGILAKKSHDKMVWAEARANLYSFEMASGGFQISVKQMEELKKHSSAVSSAAGVFLVLFGLQVVPIGLLIRSLVRLIKNRDSC